MMAPQSKVSDQLAPIPLTEAARAVLSQVTAPLQQRKSVSYNNAFLEDYQPNVSQYLSDEDIKKLTELGQTTMPTQPAGTYIKSILDRFIIDLSWNSSRLEGNTYSLLDTQRLLSEDLLAEHKSTLEAQMLLNHKEAIEFMVRSIDDIGFNRYTVLNLHGLLSNNLLADAGASGRLRHIGVGISHSVYEPSAVPQQISDMFDVILLKAGQIENPFEQAFFIMVHLPYLQPFDDVNKRVSRLACNIPFARHNLSPLSFVDVQDDLYICGLLGVYELNSIVLLKDVFLWAYERSAVRYAAIRQTVGEPDPFRLKYRNEMSELIHQIISAAMDKQQAVKAVYSAAVDLPLADKDRFIEMVETELLNLHEGNFARYRVTPSVFYAWQKVW
jgi:Fic family protein